jgi:deoxyribonuclease-2
MISPLNNEKGKTVDWWFAYKLPVDVGPKNDSSGFEFLYCDSDSTKELELSPISLDHDNSALGFTLKQVFSKKTDDGFVMWNDEIPPSKEDPKPQNKGSKGHSKGILGFSKKSNSGFYLLHSTPRFPLRGMLDLPEYEKKYGQTFLCVGFNDFKIANDIAQILLSQNQVQVYDSHLPNVEKDEAIYALANDIKVDTPSQPAIYDFKTPGGTKFQLMAKNKYWSNPKKGEAAGKDFWKDWVGPNLNCDLSVETWRRGYVFGDNDSNSNKETLDVMSIDLTACGMKGFGWPFTKDHAKWGVSESKKDSLVVIADINRQTSQAKRGGGGLVFKCPWLWNSLREIEKVETVPEKGIHLDKV